MARNPTEASGPANGSARRWSRGDSASRRKRASRPNREPSRRDQAGAVFLDELGSGDFSSQEFREPLRREDSARDCGGLAVSGERVANAGRVSRREDVSKLGGVLLEEDGLAPEDLSARTQRGQVLRKGAVRFPEARREAFPPAAGLAKPLLRHDAGEVDAAVFDAREAAIAAGKKIEVNAPREVARIALVVPAPAEEAAGFLRREFPLERNVERRPPSPRGEQRASGVPLFAVRPAGGDLEPLGKISLEAADVARKQHLRSAPGCVRREHRVEGPSGDPGRRLRKREAAGASVGKVEPAFDDGLRAGALELRPEIPPFQLAPPAGGEKLAADLVPGKDVLLEDRDGEAGAGELRGRGGAGRARSDDRDVELFGHVRAESSSRNGETFRSSKRTSPAPRAISATSPIV